jgi:uncharacterized membrane protein
MFAKADWMKTIVGISIIGIFSFMVYMIFAYDMSDTKETIIVHVLGIIEGMLIMIGNYYFGSSKGSQDKQEIIKQQNEAANK